IVPSSCSFSTGAYCQGMVLGSNVSSSKAALFLTNTQQYPILNPQILTNISNIGLSTGKCTPSFVLPGGAIICNVTLPTKAISTGTLISGKLYLSAIPCPSGNANACSSGQRQTYVGNFNSHASPLLTNITTSIFISAANLTQAANGGYDPVTATVYLLGYPFEGATVNFAASNPETGSPLSNVSLKPSIETTNSNGEAVSLVSSTNRGPVKVTASFAGISANVIIYFIMPAYVTFEETPQISVNKPSLIVDNVEYYPYQLPITFSWNPGSKHTYNFLDINSPSVKYKFESVSGCNISGKGGIINAISNCTALATYNEIIITTTTTITSTTTQTTTIMPTTTVLPPGWKVYTTCVPPPVPTTCACSCNGGPKIVNPCAYPQPTSLDGEVFSSYSVTPPGAYNNLNTYYYFNKTYRIGGVIQTKRNYTFSIIDDNSGEAAWFNFPVWFAIGSSTQSSTGAIIMYDPCSGACFGILNSSTTLGTIATYNNQSQLVNETTGDYPALIANYTYCTSGTRNTGSVAEKTFTVNIYYVDKNHVIVSIPTVNEKYSVTLPSPIEKNNMYFTVGYAYDQGFGGGGSNDNGNPEGAINIISNLTLIPVNYTAV
ncbi:MAG: Ig-like domain-containing protein, partial [Candidatus Micrarchaeia archaeon]